MDKYFIIKSEKGGVVNVSLRPPSSNPNMDYLNSFISIWTNRIDVESPFKTVDEAEEFVVKVMELLKE